MKYEIELLKDLLEKIKRVEEDEGKIPIVKDRKPNADIVGREFKWLTVLEKTKTRDRNGSILYKCKCRCGNTVYYSCSDIRKNTSCGCYRFSKDKVDKIRKTMKCFENTSIRLLENRRINSNNTSGVTGVSYNKSKGKWVAYIKLQGKNINLGTFNSKDEAVQARLKGEEKYYKPLIQKYYMEEDNE